MIKPPFLPIVYVRGYAGTQSAVEDAVADPYMGFNIGATKFRQRWTGDIGRHVFESPLVRLMKDYDYKDVFVDGQESFDSRRLPARSVWIYRYYEPVSKDLGQGERPEIEDYARGLADFLQRLRAAMAGSTKRAQRGFKVYLVAHSMGGLVVRAYLQNIAPAMAAVGGDPVAADKVFTYATPHGGIDFRLIGNVPGFLQFHNVDNFNARRMRQYLAIRGRSKPVRALDGHFDAARFFCLIGTNSRDYRVLYGLSSAAVGPLSDGLVQIRNAYVENSPRAFVHRSHAGHYGIVNSEEGYQNLVRFLFGDVRVDGYLDIDTITLPDRVRQEKESGKQVRASYHVEVVVRTQGANWDMHRRLVSEESAIFCDYATYVRGKKLVHLFSSFLSKKEIATRGKRTMGFALELGVLVPEYEVDGRLRADRHFAGGYIFRDKLNLQLAMDKQGVRLRYGWDSELPNEAAEQASLFKDEACWICELPVETHADPGIRARLRLKASQWK
jgi:pimeloyl-ACP methyl ester carboxylesterase